jgi:hypothetical protein
MSILLRDRIKESDYLIETIPIIESTNRIIYVLNDTIVNSVKMLAENDSSNWTTLKIKAISFEIIIRNNIKNWNGVIPPRKTIDFHNCYKRKLKEQAQFVQMIISGAQSCNPEILNSIIRIGHALPKHCDECYDLLGE